MQVFACTLHAASYVLGVAAVGEMPVRGVGLPELVGQLGLEADERRARSPLRLRRDEPVALQDAPDRGHRGGTAALQAEVMRNGVWTAVVALHLELPGARRRSPRVAASPPPGRLTAGQVPQITGEQRQATR